MISWYPSHLILSCESTSNSGSTLLIPTLTGRRGLTKFGLRNLGSDDEEEVPVDMHKAKNLEFSKNKQGDLILPPNRIFQNHSTKAKGYQRVHWHYLS